MRFTRSSIVLVWCFFGVCSVSLLEKKLKSNLQNRYTALQFNDSPKRRAEFESEISVRPRSNMWQNKGGGRDVDERTTKHGSKKKPKRSRIRFGTSYPRTTARKKVTTKKADGGGGVGTTTKHRSNPKEKKGTKRKHIANGSSTKISPFQGLGISRPTIKARKKAMPKKKQGPNRGQKKSTKPKTQGASPNISPFQEHGISDSNTKARKKTTHKQVGGKSKTPKNGSNPEQKKGSNIEPRGKGSTPKSSSQQFQRFGLANSRNKTRKNAKTMKKQGPNRGQELISRIKPKTKDASPKISPFQKFGISDSRIKAWKKSTTKKAGGEGRTPKHGSNPEQKKESKIETGGKSSTPKSPSQQIRRYGLSASKNKTRNNTETMEESNEMRSSEGEIPEEDFITSSADGIPSGNYSGSGDLLEDYNGEGPLNGYEDIMALPNGSKINSHVLPSTIANKTKNKGTHISLNEASYSQYTVCLHRCSVITAILSGNHTGNRSFDGIDDDIAILSGNYTGNSTSDVIDYIIGLHNGSKTHERIENTSINNSSTRNESSIFSTRFTYTMCADRCYAYYKPYSNGTTGSAEDEVSTQNGSTILNYTTVHITSQVSVEIVKENSTRPTVGDRRPSVSTSITAIEANEYDGMSSGQDDDTFNLSGDNEEDEYVYLNPTTMISIGKSLNNSSNEADHNSESTVAGWNTTHDNTAANHSRKEYSDHPLVCWSCSSIVSFDCEKLETIFGEPPEVNARLITTCKSGYCGYFTFAMDYGFGTVMQQRTCAKDPTTFCNDSNTLLSLINTTTNALKCSVCNTPLCNNSFLQSINSVLIALVFLKTITIQLYTAPESLLHY